MWPLRLNCETWSLRDHLSASCFTVSLQRFAECIIIGIHQQTIYKSEAKLYYKEETHPKWCLESHVCPQLLPPPPLHASNSHL